MSAIAALPFLLAASATALVLGLAPGWTSAEQPSGMALAACAAFVPYALLLWVPLPVRSRVALGCALGLALAAGIALCRAPAMLSDDVYRHQWDGKLVAHGVDPYAYAPDAAALTDLRDASHARINHRSVPTIYPPLAELVFAVGYRVHPSPLGQRVIALVLHLACVLVVFGWLDRARPQHAASNAARAATLLALNPLALLECALNGHIDVAVGGLAVAFLWALARPAHAAAALVAASLLKVIGVLWLPALWRRSRAASLAALAIVLLGLWPVWRAGADQSQASGLHHYLNRWQGNAALFSAIERGTRASVDTLAALTPADPDVRSDELRLPWAAPLARALAGTPLDPHPLPLVDFKAPRPVDVVSRAHLAGLSARVTALLLLVAWLWWLLSARVAAPELLRLALFGALLLAPQVHPWYLLWLLPLELALGRRAGVLWSALVLTAYASIDHWLASRHWIEAPWAAALQSAIVLCALWVEGVRSRPDGHVDPVEGADYPRPPRS